MAFVYEVNGQRVEFDREPTDADIDEAARALGAPAPAAAPDAAATTGLQLEETPNMARDVAIGAGGLAGAAALGYGAYKAAPYVIPAAQAAGPAMKQFPSALAKQYLSRPITGLAADAAALAHGLPPPTATQQALSSLGQGSKAAAQRVATGPVAPTPAQVAGNPMLSEMARRQAATANQSMLQKGMEMATKMREIAANKVMQNAGMINKLGVGLGALTYSGELNAGEDEELRRRRAMPPTTR